MAINKNHEFEDLDSIKCAIVEKNASAERVAFLKKILELNKFQVVVVDSPAPKAAPAAPVAAAPVTEGDTTPAPVPAPAAPAAPTTFTVGVTDLTFNATNAIFSRQLKTADGHIVTLAYWQEKEAVSNDELPYFENIK
ncbi:MAG: hypothetical protein NTY43_09180 [Bacteroidetes bacterium]|jgi:hypothetical protein|nr:hypothetical protein [Bacteroidota bacterium]